MKLLCILSDYWLVNKELKWNSQSLLLIFPWKFYGLMLMLFGWRVNVGNPYLFSCIACAWILYKNVFKWYYNTYVDERNDWIKWKQHCTTEANERIWEACCNDARDAKSWRKWLAEFYKGRIKTTNKANVSW